MGLSVGGLLILPAGQLMFWEVDQPPEESLSTGTLEALRMASQMEVFPSTVPLGVSPLVGLAGVFLSTDPRAHRSTGTLDGFVGEMAGKEATIFCSRRFSTNCAGAACGLEISSI